MEKTVAEILSGAGIWLKSQRPGRVEKIICPKCEGGRTKEKSLRVVIDEDGNGALWKCYRGGCGMSGGGRTTNGSRSTAGHEVRQRPVGKPVTPHAPDVTARRPDWFWSFWDDRKIGARVIEKFGVYAVRRRFDAETEGEAIVFPYVWRGELRNRKYRHYPNKHPMLQEKEALPTLFNADILDAFPETVCWVEGEPDVLALAECGIDDVVSLKDGAPAKAENSGRRYDAMATHEIELARVRRFILAGDSDAPGQALHEELARRLGRHRCWAVTWPEGCKDAGETLVKHGPDKVKACIEEAMAWPIEGIEKVQEGTLAKHGKRVPPQTMTTGTAATDNVVKLPAEGRLIVVTGYPSSGKTAWCRFAMVHTAMNFGRRWCVFSPECQPWEDFIVSVAETYSGKPFWPVLGYSKMSDAEIDAAERWLGDKVAMLVCDALEQTPTLDWLMTRLEAVVLRDGITDFLIDPWNEIIQERGEMTETDYIGASLQRLKAFGLRHGVNIWIVAHPAKPPPVRGNEVRGAPGPYDISSSSHWFNKADVGLTVHSPEPGKSELWLWKARFRRFGIRNKRATVLHDAVTGRYEDTPETKANQQWPDFFEGR